MERDLLSFHDEGTGGITGVSTPPPPNCMNIPNVTVKFSSVDLLYGILTFSGSFSVSHLP